MAKLGDTTVFGSLNVSEGIGVPVYQSTNDVPSLPEGTIVYIKDDNSLYIEDGK